MPDPRTLIPLDDHQVRRLEQLREFDPIASWCQEKGDEGVCVDACGLRFYGSTFHQAIGRALRGLSRGETRRAA